MLCAILRNTWPKSFVLVTPTRKSIRFYRGKIHIIFKSKPTDSKTSIKSKARGKENDFHSTHQTTHSIQLSGVMTAVSFTQVSSLKAYFCPPAALLIKFIKPCLTEFFKFFITVSVRNNIRHYSTAVTIVEVLFHQE